MPEIVLTNITKRWGKFYAVDNVNLTIEDNSFITLLGPSGCGKTTILRMIAGLETPTSGRITLGDRVVFDSELGINMPANQRKVGFLFQNYALWPNMTVYDNIAFGLSNIKESMPKVAEEGKCASQLIAALENVNDICELLSGCKNKTGNIDEKTALIKLIDKFTLSQYTAKTLLGYQLTPGKDVSDIVADLHTKVERVKSSATANGFTLNENFEFIKNGEPVMEVRKMSKEEVDLVVRRVSRIVKIGMFMERYPAELSGGQQQRVAIARTLAPEPTVLFMDEPLSNLDAKLRLEMRYELQRLHLESSSTFVYVTHDQMEAMTLATKICLLNNGTLQQYDAPLTVYHHPNNLFTADFVGNPSINFVDATGTQKADGSFALSIFNGKSLRFTPNDPLVLTEWRSQLAESTALTHKDAQEKTGKRSYVEKENKDEAFVYPVAKTGYDLVTLHEEKQITDQDFVLGIRPEFVQLVDESAMPGEIYGAMPTGMESTVKICVGEYLLTSVVFGSALFHIGEKIAINFSGNSVALFDKKSQRLITTGSLSL